MFDWIRSLFVRVPKPDHPEFDVSEQEIVERLAKLRHQSPDELRQDARRRARMLVEVDSMRRQ